MRDQVCPDHAWILQCPLRSEFECLGHQPTSAVSLVEAVQEFGPPEGTLVSDRDLTDKVAVGNESDRERGESLGPLLEAAWGSATEC